ncbi:MAG: endonuclease III [Gammaproteobacteria bacterium]
MNEAARQAFFERLRTSNPEPASELNFRNPFELLIAVILSAQATDASVNRVTPALFAAAPDAPALAALGERRARGIIKTIGLFNTKARNIVRTAQLLVERHGGRVPADRSQLEALPGVGRKTANVILNVAFGQPTIAVDTHIFRVSNRTGLAPGATPLAVEQGLIAAVPEPFKNDAHHWLILHGRYVCTARKPRCGECVVRDLCAWDGREGPRPASGKAKGRGTQRTKKPKAPRRSTRAVPGERDRR